MLYILHYIRLKCLLQRAIPVTATSQTSNETSQLVFRSATHQKARPNVNRRSHSHGNTNTHQVRWDLQTDGTLSSSLGAPFQQVSQRSQSKPRQLNATINRNNARHGVDCQCADHTRRHPGPIKFSKLILRLANTNLLLSPPQAHIVFSEDHKKHSAWVFTATVHTRIPDWKLLWKDWQLSYSKHLAIRSYSCPSSVRHIKTTPLFHAESLSDKGKSISNRLLAIGLASRSICLQTAHLLDEYCYFITSAKQTYKHITSVLTTTRVPHQKTFHLTCRNYTAGYTL